jgi:hypothetical protein
LNGAFKRSSAWPSQAAGRFIPAAEGPMFVSPQSSSDDRPAWWVVLLFLCSLAFTGTAALLLATI